MQIVIPTEVYSQVKALPSGSLATLAAMTNGSEVPTLTRPGSNGAMTIFADRLVVKGRVNGKIFKVSEVRAGRSA